MGFLRKVHGKTREKVRSCEIRKNSGRRAFYPNRDFSCDGSAT